MNTQTIHSMTTAGIVCPHCWKPLSFFLLVRPDIEPNRVARRHYGGWCTRMSCGHGVIAMQYLEGPVWKMHQFKIYLVDRSRDDGGLIESDWIVVNPLPEPEAQVKPEPHTRGATPASPVLILGPGGDYRQIVDVTGEGLLTTLLKHMKGAIDSVEALLPLWRSKNNQPANAETSHEHNC
jgi:hypothetical protein